jgi:single-strand DNA-binding protein
MLTAQVIGNVGRDATINEINGDFAMNFSVAHNERVVTGDGEVIEKTVWVNCTRWLKKRTELARYLKKGTLVHVAGKPEFKIYKGNDGRNRVDVRLRVDAIELLSSKEQSAAPTSSDDSFPKADPNEMTDADWEGTTSNAA